MADLLTPTRSIPYYGRCGNHITVDQHDSLDTQQGPVCGFEGVVELLIFDETETALWECGDYDHHQNYVPWEATL